MRLPSVSSILGDYPNNKRQPKIHTLHNNDVTSINSLIRRLGNDALYKLFTFHIFLQHQSTVEKMVKDRETVIKYALSYV
jgi:hypothetical protein